MSPLSPERARAFFSGVFHTTQIQFVDLKWNRLLYQLLALVLTYALLLQLVPRVASARTSPPVRSSKEAQTVPSRTSSFTPELIDGGVEGVPNNGLSPMSGNDVSTFPGIVGLDSVTISAGSAYVDSFDSMSAYADSHGSHANVFSNGQIDLKGAKVYGNVVSTQGNVILESGSLVSGDLTYATTLTNSGTVQGTISRQTTSPFTAAVPIACGSYRTAPTSLNNWVMGNFTYDQTSGDLTVSGGNAATLANGTYCLHDVTLSGGSTLTVNGAVVINLTGQLKASGGSFANTTNRPANLQISTSYTGNNGVTLSGGTNAYLKVLAPGTSITLSGGSPIFGALVGKTLTVSGNSVIHYDTRQPDTTPPRVAIISPVDNSTTTSASVAVSGTASDNGSNDTGLANITVNGTAASYDPATGTWSLTSIDLVLGSNTITAVATDNTGNQSSTQITVTRQSPPNQPPTVSAGQNQTITVPATASLNGSASDDDLPVGTLTTTWSQVSGPGTVSFGDPNVTVTTAAFSTSGTYVLRLTASDSQLSSVSDVTVTVIPQNQAPTANAGADQTITLPNVASLNGSVSDDGLPSGNLSTLWTTVSGPGTVTFANPGATVTTASFSAPGTYILRLSASDSQLSAGDDLSINVIPQNHAPTVDAGADQSITLPSTASLNGTISDDGLPSGSTLTSSWTQVTGPGTVTFLNPNSAATLASFSTAGDYVLRLTASDSQLTTSDEIAITVIAENHAPTVNAGADQTIALPSAATLNGIVSDDGLPAASTVTTSWTKVSGPGEVIFATPNNTLTTASFSAAGTYMLRLTASDSQLATSDDLVIVVDPENQAPNVNAGADQTVTLPSAANLNAVVTDDSWPRGSSVSVIWSKVSGPGTVTFDNPNSVLTTASFSAAGTYVLQLTASDSQLSASDDLVVTVISENHAPTANAGADQQITLPNLANLNGSVSDDGLPSGSSLSSAWSKVSGPGTVTFANPNVTVTTAAFSEAGTYVLRLTVNDSQLTASDDLQIIVIPENHAPTVSAGADQEITLPGTASLNGSAVDDGLPSGSTLNSTWSKVSGPGTVTFAAPNNPVTTASFSVAGVYVLHLTASDSELSASDDLVVTVIPENHAPTTNAGPDQQITLPNVASLNGSVSDDGLPAGSNLTSVWAKVSGPGVVTFSNANAAVTSAAFSEAGTYVLRLTADDSQLSSSDDIVITVIPENHAPSVSAGADQEITLPAVASLSGTAVDDGLPSGSTLNSTWSKVSGPGTVTFGAANNTSTTASFSVAGTYVLRLTASDSQLSSSDDIVVTVIPENHAPAANAGPDQQITLPNVANLNGGVSDDGLPSGSTLTSTWSKVSGPGSVTFANPNVTVTTAAFSEAGTYILRLTANDSQLSVADELVVTVDAANQPPSANAGPDQSTSINANLVANPGNEQPLLNGLIAGWTAVSGTWTQGTVNGFPQAQQGNSYFFAGSAAQGELYQDIDVSAFSPGIDAGAQQFAFQTYLRSATEAPPDLARVAVEYRDAANTNIIGSLDSGTTSIDSLLNDEFNDTAINSKWLKIGTETTMVESNGSLHLSMPSLSTDKGNLLVQPMPAGNWEMVTRIDNQAAYRNYNSTGLLIAGDVANNPGTAGLMVYQDAHFASGHSLEVSRFVNRFTFGGDLLPIPTLPTSANPIWQKIVKTGTSYTFFYSTDGTTYTQVGSAVAQSSFGFTPAYVGVFMNNALTGVPIDAYIDFFHISAGPATDAWHVFEDTRPAPAGTRSIRIRLLATRNSGATNDAFFDAVSLRPVGTAAVKLNGSMSDDGLPVGSSLTSNWSVASGPGNVVFENANSRSSGASFNTAGTYVLRLTANDSQLTASDEVQVVVIPENQPPSVSAGPDQNIASCTTNLQGTAADDGLPSGSVLAISWSKVSGPGNVTFANPSSPSTSASFSVAGDYVLRLTVDDSDRASTDDVAVSFTFTSTTPAQYFQPTPYLSAQDSPFKNTTFSYSYLENFEDHLLNTPGVTANAGGVVSVIFGPGNHDSVDADDGVIDGHGGTGDDYFSDNGSAGVKFTFDASVLGSLPTHAGVVWTDGAGDVYFEAFDRNGVSMGLQGPYHLPDAVFADTTAEDRFLGASNPQGISAIRVLNTSGGIEVDHLQYGRAFDNNAPIVNAGSDQTIFLPAMSANLNGSAIDDGLPGCAQLSIAWSQVSGPGTATFANANSATTTATFSAEGTYVLRLTANDSQFTTADDVTVIITTNQPPVANFVVPESTGTAGSFVIESSGAGGGSVANVLDDNGSTFWQTTGIANHFAKFQFFDQQNVFIDRVRLQGLAQTNSLKDFEVLVSSTNANDASFSTVLTGTLNNIGQLQEFPFAGGPVRARFIKVLLKTNYGSPGSIVLSTFNPVAVGSADSLLSLPGIANVARSQSPAMIFNGAAIYSASYGSGLNNADGLLGYARGGFVTTTKTNEFAIIQLGGATVPNLKGVRIATWYDSGFGLTTGVKDFEIWVSTTTPDQASFTKVLSAATAPVGNMQTFMFPGGPVAARYLKYVPLTTHGTGANINTVSLDVISDAGARVIAASSENQNSPLPPEAAFDGDISTAWFSQQGAVTDVWVKTALADDQVRKVYGFRIYPSNSVSFLQGPKDIEIRVSTTTTDDSAFTTVYAGTLPAALSGNPQEIFLSNLVDAKYVQFFWKTGLSPSFIGVRELEVLAAPSRGSGVVSFSPGAGNVETALDLDPANQPWTTPLNQNTNVSFTLVMPRAEVQTINHIALRPAIAFNGNFSAPKDFQLQVSTTDAADSSFTTAFAGTLVNSIQLQDFYFNPVQAKYVRLVIVKGPTDFGSYALHNFLIYAADTVGTTTRFIDRSADSDGQVVSWSWNFGDGTTSNEKNPVHTFAQPGDYTVSLTVTDNSGQSHTFAKVYHVIASINADFAISPMIAHECGENVRVTDIAELLSVSGAQRRYNFGDGTALFTQNAKSSIHTFQDSGVFHVTLNVGDILGASHTITRDITVLNLPPSVDIDPGKTLVWGESWTSVPRINDQSPIDRTSLQGQWDFGDGQTSNCANCTNANATVTHAYAHPGSYHALLTITDKDGGVGSDSADFIINKRPTKLVFQNPPAQTDGQPLIIHAQLFDTFANLPLSGKPVQFTLNGAPFSAVTGANGVAEVSVPLPAGTKIDIITGTFAEDEFYLGCGGVTVPATAGSAPPAGTLGSQGTNFWLMFPHAFFDGNLAVQRLYISSRVDTTGTVTIPGGGFNFTQNFTVQANTITTIQLPFVQVYESNIVQAKGIHVTSQQPVTVYGLNQRFFTSDAFLALPVNTLGTDHLILTYSNMGFSPTSELGIVASENSTTVTITPAVTTGTRIGGVPYNITLNQGQTYLLQNTVPTTAGDLTGSRVTSDKPIAVFGGHAAATIPAEAVCCADHLVEQMTPINVWGKRFATMPIATRTKGDFFRFIASQDGTNIYLNGNLVAMLNRGQWVEKIIKDPTEIIATSPIMVAQYATSVFYDPPTTGKADPFEMIIPPYSQFLNHYTVSTPGTGFAINYANVVAPTASLGSITLDSNPIPASSFTPIGVSGYSGAQVPIAAGMHNFDGPASFGVFIYGFNQDEGYGYPGGMNMSPAVQAVNIAVTPETSDHPISNQACLLATVTNQDQFPLGGRTITFTVTGVNPTTSSATTDAAGQATFCYTGTNLGSDLVRAMLDSTSGTASVQWRTLVTNRAPTVNAGSDQIITLPAPANLQGSASDDGLPVNTLNVSWSKVSGPGNVTFANAILAVTSATFDAQGVYVLRLTASDTDLSTSDDVQVTVNPTPPNQPPAANAGADQSAAIKGNLVVNPGADQPLVNGEVPGWTEELGTTWTQGNSSIAGLPAPQLGNSFFYVGADGAQNAELRQDVDVSAFANTIAAGTQQFEFQSWLMSGSEFPYPDNPRVIFEFRNAQNNTVLGTYDTSTPYVIGSWHLIEGIQAAPIGTGWIRVRLIATRNQGPYNDSYFDSISLRPIGNTAVKLNGTVSDDGLPYGSSVSANWTAVGGPAPVTFTNANAPDSAASFTAAGAYVLRLTASDEQLTTTDDVTVTINPQNHAPTVATGTQQTITLPATAPLNGTVNDDGLPVGSTLSVHWTKDTGPGIVTFANPNAASTTASFSTPGFYVLMLNVDDSEYAASTPFYVTVNPAPVNQPPTVSAGADQIFSLPTDTTTLNGSAADDGYPAGSSLSVIWTKVGGPGTVIFGTPNAAVTTAQFSAAGNYVLRLTASDGTLSTSDDVNVTVTPANQAPTVNAGSDQTTILSAGAQLNGSASDDGYPVGGALTTTWSKVSGPGTVTFLNPNAAITGANFSATGTYVLRLTASDTALTSSDDVTITVNDNVPGPTVQITAPADDASVTEPAIVTGAVSGGAWTLEYSLDSTDDQNNRVWNQLASGNGAANGTLGTIDPTMMLNGLFDIRLSSTDQYGQTSSTKVSVIVERNLKVGNFTVSFTDLSIPVAGVPMEVTRTYDSRDKRVGDFGFGWTLGLHNIRVEKSSVVGLKWYETVSQEVFPNYCLEPVGSHAVTVTFPGGKVFKFQPNVAPHCQRNAPITSANISFTPMPGTVGKLEVIGSSDVQIDGSVPGPVNLIGFGGGVDIFNSFTFKFTAEDGTAYIIDQRTGLQSLADPNGNTLTISTGGIVHSSGKSIVFNRDIAGRITSIVDPNGNSMTYAYDPNGDLISYTDNENNTTTYTYDANHRLLTIHDPRGIQPIRNDYDPSGRLISHTDGFGKVITYVHDIPNRTETVTDRLGHPTVFAYDERGNVLRKTDARGGVTSYTYDANDNVLTETNALGKTTTYTYDANDHRTSITDPLNNVTQFTYNTLGKVLTQTDPLGHVTTNTYNSHGDLLTTEDSLHNVTSYIYSVFGGQLISTTDALNKTTHFDYTGSYLTKATDALGHEAAFTYDSNGNRASETVTRTNTQGQVETITTSYEYDKLNRLKKTTFADGSFTKVEYNSIGQVSATIDQLDHRTELTYDDMGRLTRITNADGEHGEITYDSEGRRLTITDRAGHLTSYTYDELGRLTKTTFADGTFLQTNYDAAGQVVTTTDARGNVAHFFYDDAGRRTKVRNALTQETTFAYDANGNQLTMTDALSHATSFEYDLANRRTRTTYPDGTFDVVAYNAVGRKVSSTDQSGKTTQFSYDELSSLTKVKDALNQETTYGYDEVGQQTSQTDASNHTTRFEYDQVGRRIKRILSSGQVESYTYDNSGSLSSKTDFNGKTTTYTYDVMQRLTSKIPDASLGQSTISFTYNAFGKRATMSDSSGATIYNYDVRNRLTGKQTPFGTLSYSYNDDGNLASTRSSNANGVSVDYGYDALNRLSAVKDNHLIALNGGLTSYTYDTVGNLQSYQYPNGVTTSYAYNSLNRLTTMTTGTPMSSLASYSYTLGAAGNRTAVTELGGRTVNYTYDNLYRLTSESIANDPHSVNGSISYSYDPVGNRLSRTSTVAPVSSQSSTYDANNRLTSDGYDNNGNTTTSSSGNGYGYDFENHLTSFNGGAVTYVYDGDGNRVGKTVAGVTTNYLIDTNNPTGYAQVVDELQGAMVVKSFTYGHDLISQRIVGGSVSFYQYDGHESVRQLTNASAAITDAYDYDAFGNLIYRSGSTPNDYLYAGEQFDPSTGLYYLRARYMDPSQGRFLTMDSNEGSAFEPASLHKYVYAANSPINLTDPSGNDFMGEVGALAVRSVLTAMSTLLRAAVFITLNYVKIVEVIGAIEFGLTALTVATDLLGQAAQFTVHRKGSVFTGQIGADGENEARRYLSEKGFDVKLSTQNNSGQGVDLIATNSKGEWCLFEVKATTSNTPVTTPLPLSDAQQDAENFIRTRLTAASNGTGAYSSLSPSARQTAAEALEEFRATMASGQTVKSFVAEARFPVGYAAVAAEEEEVEFLLTFRRWWRQQ